MRVDKLAEGLLYFLVAMIFVGAVTILLGYQKKPEAELAATPEPATAEAFRLDVSTGTILATLSADAKTFTLTLDAPDALQLCAAQPEGPPTCIALGELRERRD